MFLSHWCFFVWAYLVVSWRPSVTALYGTALAVRASDGPGGVQGTELEDFENLIDTH